MVESLEALHILDLSKAAYQDRVVPCPGLLGVKKA